MRPGLPACAGPLLGIAAGVSTAVFATFVDGSPAKMAALPAVVALLAFLVIDAKKLLITILALRSAGDVLLDSTRISLGGYETGVGGLLNAFVILIVALLFLEKPRLLPGKGVAMWTGLLLAALLGVAIAPVKADAIRTCLALLSYFAVFAGAFFVVRSAADFRLCVKVILWSSAIPAVYAVVELATGGMPGAEGTRLHSTFAHPNIFAFYLTVIIALTLYLMKDGAPKLSAVGKAALGVYMLFMIALLILTKTRSAWIACLTIFAIYGLACERRYLAYLVIAPLLALLVPGVQERLLELGTGNDYVQYAKLNSFAWRRLLWDSALRWMHPDHYILGYGLESFRNYSPTFFPLANPRADPPGAHNIYVQLLFELGAVGLLAFLWLFGRLLWWLKSLSPTDPLAAVILLSLTLAYLIASISDNLLVYLSFDWYFWFLAGAGCAWAHLGAADRRSAAQAAPSAHSGTRQRAGVPTT